MAEGAGVSGAVLGEVLEDEWSEKSRACSWAQRWRFSAAHQTQTAEQARMTRFFRRFRNLFIDSTSFIEDKETPQHRGAKQRKKAQKLWGTRDAGREERRMARGPLEKERALPEPVQAFSGFTKYLLHLRCLFSIIKAKFIFIVI